MSESALFEERQFLGFNRNGLTSRILMALFCFMAYYWSQNPKPVNVSGIHIGAYPVENIPNSGALFFMLGLIILVISSILVFIPHMHTRILENCILIDGLWNSRKVKIDLNSVIEVKRIQFKKVLLTLPSYNLHSKGTIQFYCHGREAVELTDRDGLKYMIGTQKAGEFERVAGKIVKSQRKEQEKLGMQS